MCIRIFNGTDWQRKHAKGFVRWYAHSYIPKSIHPKLSISVCLYGSKTAWKKVATDKADLGYCEYMEEDRLLGHEHCKISLYVPKSIIYYKFLNRLAHECVHTKQYVTHELKDLSNRTIFRKESFADESILYWNQPWEIEALGHEYGLVKLYAVEADIYKTVFTRKVKAIVN